MRCHHAANVFKIHRLRHSFFSRVRIHSISTRLCGYHQNRWTFIIYEQTTRWFSTAPWLLPRSTSLHYLKLFLLASVEVLFCQGEAYSKTYHSHFKWLTTYISNKLVQFLSCIIESIYFFFLHQVVLMIVITNDY